MIKAKLKYEYRSSTHRIMSVLLENGIDIRSQTDCYNYYITCIFKDEEQLNKILLILTKQYSIDITICSKRKLFDFKSWWEKLNK